MQSERNYADGPKRSRELDLHFEALRLDMRKAIAEEVESQMKDIRTAIGTVNDSGTGGTGLSGQVARNNTRVDQLFTLKHMGMGIIVAISFTAMLLLLGFKTWIIELATGKAPTPLI